MWGVIKGEFESPRIIADKEQGLAFGLRLQRDQPRFLTGRTEDRQNPNGSLTDFTAL